MKKILPLLTFLMISIGAYAEKYPNIVIILADDLGYGDVRANNPRSLIPTPAMDRLAEQGMRFTDAHSPSAVCTPTRYGLLTGRYCWRTSLKRGVLNGYGRPIIDLNRHTIAEVLQDAGYVAGCFGKWHLGLDIAHEDSGNPRKPNYDFSAPVKNGPLNHGFDLSYILPGSLNMAPYTYLDGDRFTEIPSENQPRTPDQITIISGGAKAPSFDFHDVPNVFTRKAVDFIETAAQSDKPFFLYFPLTAPHKPVLPTEAFKGESPRGIYGDFVMEVDDVVRRIDETLKRNKVADETLLILTSDNGSFMYRIDEDQPDHLKDWRVVGYHPSVHESNGPWRGTKADIYEAGHRVPMLVRWPKTIQPGSVNTNTVCLTDWYATLAELVGHKLSDTEGEDSASLLPILKNAPHDWSRPPVIHHSSRGMFAIRKGPWKLIAGNGSGGRQKPLGEPNKHPFQLYNLSEDKSERHDLIQKHPAVAQQLEDALKQIQLSGRSVNH